MSDRSSSRWSGVQRLIAFLAVAGGMSALFALTACAPIMSVAGSRVKLLADAISYVQSGKTLSDHALSNVTGMECSTFNVALGSPICSTLNHVAPVEERGPSSGVNAASAVLHERRYRDQQRTGFDS